MKIKRTKELNQLSELYNLHHEVLSEMIIVRGIKANVFADHQDYFGVSIQEACIAANRTVLAFMVYALPKGIANRILPLMGNLVLIGEDDCPECGFKLDRDTQKVHGLDYTEVNCSCCGYVSPDNPDWDSMKGGCDHE